MDCAANFDPRRPGTQLPPFSQRPYRYAKFFGRFDFRSMAGNFRLSPQRTALALPHRLRSYCCLFPLLAVEAIWRATSRQVSRDLPWLFAAEAEKQLLCKRGKVFRID